VLEIWKAVVLGIVEGLTEFLPVSSTGHLTITEKLMGLPIEGKGITAFTAIIQMGAIIAAIIYFWKDFWRVIKGFFGGLFSAEKRQGQDWRLALFVIVGSIPIAVVGLLAKSFIENQLRSLWVVATALIAWCAVMIFAERAATQTRHENALRVSDGVFMGVMQVFSLIPGVSRSGTTIAAGLLRDLDRVTATRMSFLLGVPALTAAGGLEAYTNRNDVADTVGWTPTLVALAVSFVVGYASIAWLLRFVAHHSIVWFVWYRLLLGAAVIALLVTGVIAAT
jgi:undecaprenyl-diphosphatase